MPRRIRPFGKLTKLCRAMVGIGWLLTFASIRAGPPFVTDDPAPPPPGGWEINVPFILERTPGSTEMDAPLFDLNYGLPNIQLKLEFPIEIAHEDNNGTAAGLGDMLLGVKWPFFNNEKSQLQIGMYPQLLLPTGDHSRGLGEGRVAFVLPLVAQKSWDKWTLYGNVGYWWRSAAESRRCRKASIYPSFSARSEEHTSELQSLTNLVCRLLLEKKKNIITLSSPRVIV